MHLGHDQIPSLLNEVEVVDVMFAETFAWVDAGKLLEADEGAIVVFPDDNETTGTVEVVLIEETFISLLEVVNTPIPDNADVGKGLLELILLGL